MPSEGTKEPAGSRLPNRLGSEKSPYLLQHSLQPVDWFPWGKEAFDKARSEDKPLFLSSGYSTCHWCHVMARESFEDAGIAAVLNRHFVPVKLDREERPDVDQVYMTYVQATTGSGGWPMSVWLTPDLEPFFGGTYFPPDDRWGRPGFTSILRRIARAWATDRARIAKTAVAAVESLRQAAAPAPPEPGALNPEWVDRAVEAFQSAYDPRHGGFGGAPKFPRPSVPDFLLRYPARSGRRGAREMALHTLRRMAEGGVYDQLGGGFHRYAVDERWRVPHFEKMLYDQALLACSFLDAFQISRDPFFSRIARETLDYVHRDLAGPQGQCFSAEDADSGLPERPDEHVEGAFYVWTHVELNALLGRETAAIFAAHHGVMEDGNIREDPHGIFQGKNILFVAQTVEDTARRFGKASGEVRRQLAEARARLLEDRAARPRPHRDDKVLTAWNGLMISAFARAARVLDDDRDRLAARRAAGFVRAHLYDSRRGLLRRRYREGEAAIDGLLEDYAFLVRGLLDLYETDFDPADLEWAVALQEKQDALFLDDGAGGYYSTSGNDRSVLLRMKDDYDGATPAANSVAVHNLLRLAAMTGCSRYRETAAKTLAAFSAMLARTPHAMPAMLSALIFHLEEPLRIVISGPPDAPKTRALLREVRSRFLPHAVVLRADVGSGQRTLAQPGTVTDPVRPPGGRASVQVCKGHACGLPTDDPAVLVRLLDEADGLGFSPRGG